MDRGDGVIDSGRICKEQFFRQVRRLARRLPDADFAIGLCEDRYHVLVSFFAVMLRGQINLLPASRASQELRDIAKDFPNAYCLVDRPNKEIAGLKRIQVERLLSVTVEDPSEVEIPPDHTAAILFTSGSTGRPQPYPKRWSELRTGVDLTRRRFGFRSNNGQTIVATVPPHHMFGLETSLLLPFAGGMRMFRGQPFYPADIDRALKGVPASRVLVTTPLHLRVCVDSGLKWPACDLVLSATAPLSGALAGQAEELFRAPVVEIFGSTETGAIASRRTVEGDIWQPYDGVTVLPEEQGILVRADHLLGDRRLNDRIELCGERGFRLLDRYSDVIKIAGKRGSLGDLTHKLNQIDGVLDGVFLIPPSPGRSSDRVAAVVVAPALNKQQILSALAQCVDPVFLPRPVVLADRLPRNETGKLPRAELLRFFLERGEDP